jgi:hypothetical protein
MSTPSVAMTKVVIDLLTAMGWDGAQELGYPLYPGIEILTEPDRAVFITATGGPGFTTEEAATDAWSFQARVRGPTDDAYEPEIMALRLDQMLLGAPYPLTVDGVRVLAANRAGSPPTPLPLDPNDLRHEFTCSYIVIAGV